MTERAVIFQVAGEQLLGILHPAQHPPLDPVTAEPDFSQRGVVIVVGGPQYRVGSHRQFLLLARYLAAHGIPVLRFDYRGMGDATGAMRDFDAVDADIAAAIDVFQSELPELQDIIVWGLCDGASAALGYAYRDPRVTGLVLLNPWMRTEQGLAKAYLRQYYLKRIVSRDFWSGLIRGRLNPLTSARSLLAMVAKVLQRSPAASTATPTHPGIDLSQPLPERMAAGWQLFQGPLLLILSGDDLTAAEFRDTAKQSPAWRGLLEQSRVCIRELPDANHTFSKREWRDQVEQWTVEWVRAHPRSPSE